MPSEHDLIKRYFTPQVSRGDIVLGVGDDAAVVQPPADMELVVTTDTLIEGVHFPATMAPEALGHKALAVNLSDLAAMGADPAWATLSVTLPEADERWLEAFSRGFLQLAERYEVDLIGGDTNRGPLSITVQAMGLLPVDTALRRDGAREGDLIYMTGTIGDAGLALAAAQGKASLKAGELELCQARLDRPMPRIEAGAALRRVASAAIDVSDGLATDLGHVLEASGVGAKLRLDDLPLSTPMWDAMQGALDWAFPLTCGDDYELLFTVPQFAWERIDQLFADLDYKATCIGMIESQPGLRCLQEDGSEYTLKTGGYEHFAD